MTHISKKEAHLVSQSEFWSCLIISVLHEWIKVACKIVEQKDVIVIVQGKTSAAPVPCI